MRRRRRKKKETAIRIWVWNFWAYFLKQPLERVSLLNLAIIPSLPSHRAAFCGPVDELTDGNCAHTHQDVGWEVGSEGTQEEGIM